MVRRLSRFILLVTIVAFSLIITNSNLFAAEEMLLNPTNFVLINPSFENGAEGWVPHGSCNYFAREQSPHDGAWVLAANRNDTEACLSISQDVTFSVQAGQTYRFAGWIRSPAEDEIWGSVAIWGLGAGDSVQSTTEYWISGQYWKCVETVFTAQVAYTGLRVELYMHSLGREFHFDHMQVREGDTPPICVEVGYGSSRQWLFQEAYDRTGGHSVLSSPTAPVQWVPNKQDPLIAAQPLESGAYLFHDEQSDDPMGSVPAYAAGGPILSHYQSLGGSYSDLGIGPTSDQFTNAQGQQQSNFPNGFITWDGTTVTRHNWSDPESGQWRVQYFNGSNLTTGPTWVSNEPVISHVWIDSAPGNGMWGVWDEHFVARWTGTFPFQAGEYTFQAQADDRVWVWIDDELIIDSQLQLATVTRNMTEGNHHIRVEMMEIEGHASISFSWSSQHSQAFLPFMNK